MTSFKGKTVLITGGASGIGYIMGQKALKRGAAHLVIWDINEQLLQHVQQSHNAAGFSVNTMNVNVAEPKEVEEAAKLVLQEFKSVDILINNAGIIVGKPFSEHSNEEIQRTVGVNQLAFMYVTKAFLPQMMANNRGHIVAITSSAGLTPNPGMVVYVSSKWGAVGWVESLRLEVQHSHPNIKFLNVMPGYIATKMFTGVTPPRFMPLLDPDRISEQIIRSVEKEKTSLKAPSLVKITTLARGILPQSWYDFVARRIFNVYSSMDTFKGKNHE